MIKIFQIIMNELLVPENLEDFYNRNSTKSLKNERSPLTRWTAILAKMELPQYYQEILEYRPMAIIEPTLQDRFLTDFCLFKNQQPIPEVIASGNMPSS